MIALLAAAALAMLPDPDAAMARVAGRAAPVRRAGREVRARAERLRDPLLRRETLAALFRPGDCVRHRIGMDAVRQRTVTAALAARGWLEPGTDPRALFPPLEGEGSACPHLAVPVLAAPGGNSGSHHSWPGGLAVHVAVNLRSGAALADGYRAIEGARFDADALAAAILWHDWAKAPLLRWRSDGVTADEPRIAGTGAHHVLGLAEAIRRGFAPRQVAIQACAHSADPASTRAWLAAAALIAGADPARFPPDTGPECMLNHLADQNWPLSDAAVETAEALLARHAARFGFDPADAARYRLCYRNPLLARLGAERIAATPAGDLEPLLAHMLSPKEVCPR